MSVVLEFPEAPQFEFLIDLQGQSLYQKWLELGNVGTESDFLNWLKLDSVAILGSGTAGHLTKFTSEGGVGNSIVQEVGSGIQVEGSGKFTDLLTVLGVVQGSLDIKRGATQAYRFFVDVINFGIYDLIGDRTVFSIKNTTGDATLTGKLKALCPIYANEATATSDSTLLSGQFYKLTGSKQVYQKD